MLKACITLFTKDSSNPMLFEVVPCCYAHSSQSHSFPAVRKQRSGPCHTSPRHSKPWAAARAKTICTLFRSNFSKHNSERTACEALPRHDRRQHFAPSRSLLLVKSNQAWFERRKFVASAVVMHFLQFFTPHRHRRGSSVLNNELLVWSTLHTTKHCPCSQRQSVAPNG